MRGRRRVRCLLAWGICVFAIPTAAWGQPPPAPPRAQAWQEQLAKADKSLSEGDLRTAQDAYGLALKTAQTGEQRVQAAVKLAGVLSRSAPGSPEAKKAQAVYQSVWKEVATPSAWPAGTGAGDLRCLYHNNFGAFLLREGDATAASKVLLTIEGEMKDSRYSSQRPGYLYNLAQGLERSGNTARAFDLYQEAAQSDSAAAPAAEAVFRMALAAEPAVGAAQASRLLSRLVEQGDPTLTEKYLKSALTTARWFREPAATFLPTVLVRYLTLNNLGPKAFGGAWRPLLEKIRPDLSQGPSARIADILRAYQSQGEAPAAGNFFPNTGGKEAQTYSAFLKMLGDWFARTGQPATAYQRYSNAWNLDRRSGEAVVYMTNILLQYPKEVDPDGRLVDHLIRQLFEEKGAAYAEQDSPNIVRLHTLLGSIFERQGKMGPPGDPRSAAFQYEHALAAQKQLQTKGAAEAVPGLNARLATAYTAIGQKPKALTQYVAATEGYVLMRKFAEADATLKKAEALEVAPAAPERSKLDQLRPVIKSNIVLRKTAEGLVSHTDNAIQATVKSMLVTNPHVKQHAIDVAVETGVVTLTGAVTDHVHKSAAEKLAKETLGVKAVKNLILVKPE